MRSFCCWIIAAGMIATSAEAQTFSEKQRNAMNHLAQVIAIEHYCDDYRSVPVMAGALAAMYKIDFDNKNVQAFMAGKFRESLAGLEKVGKRVGCLVGWSLYGEGGQNVPGLIVRK